MPLNNIVTLSSSGTTQLTSAGSGAGPAGWLLTFRGLSWTGSIVLKSNQAPPGAAPNYVSVAYTDPGTGVITAAGTAITADTSQVVEATGYDLYAVYTHTAGEVAIYIEPAMNIATSGGLVVPAGDVTSGTFGAFQGPDTGAYTFPSSVVVTTTVTAAEYVGPVLSTNAVASQTYAATSAGLYASTVSGGVLSGFGTTHDVALKNRAGTTVAGVLANGTTFAVVGATTFTTLLSSVTAFATPSALAATAFNAFASTVSGGVLMGFGTAFDVTLMNRAGTAVLGIGPNTTDVTVAGPITMTGSVANPAGTVRYIGGQATGTTDVVANALSGGTHTWRVAGLSALQLGASALAYGRVGGTFDFNGSTATGADQPSGVTTYNANIGTGTGSVGGYVFKVPVTHGSDSVAQTLTTALTIGGTTVTTVKVAGGFSCNGTNPQTAFASGGALNAYGAGVNGLDSGANMSALHAMVVAIRAALVADGIMS